MAAVQPLLPAAMVRAKLAWMACFSTATEPSRAAVARATALVELAERLGSEMERAIAMAQDGGAGGTLAEFEQLVARVETRVQEFTSLADDVATAVHEVSSGDAMVEPAGRDDTDSRVMFPTGPVAYDLPSMKTYCARVAPPYAAYLPKNRR